MATALLGRWNTSGSLAPETPLPVLPPQEVAGDEDDALLRAIHLIERQSKLIEDQRLEIIGLRAQIDVLKSVFCPTIAPADPVSHDGTWLTVEQVARATGRSVSGAYNLVATKRVTFEKRGRDYYILASSVPPRRGQKKGSHGV